MILIGSGANDYIYHKSHFCDIFHNHDHECQCISVITYENLHSATLSGRGQRPFQNKIG